MPKYGLTYESAFDPCQNLRAASLILKDCYDRAKSRSLNDQDALQASFSCYYSGNFSTGFRPDFKGQPSYVQKVLNSAGIGDQARPVSPIRVIAHTKTKAEPVAKASRASAFKVTAMAEGEDRTIAKGYGSGNDSVMVYR